MKKIQIALLSAVLVAVFASVSAFASCGNCPGDKGAKASCPTDKDKGAKASCPATAAKDAKGCCAAKGAAAGPAELTGKVEAKTEKAADGTETTSYYLTVSDAKCAAGKECPHVKGKTLKLTGPKAAEAEKLAGKEVQAKGTCGSGCTEFDVASLAEKK